MRRTIGMSSYVTAAFAAIVLWVGTVSGTRAPAEPASTARVMVTYVHRKRPPPSPCTALPA